MIKTIKNNISIVLLVIALLIGLSLLLYPTVSDWWNSNHQSKAIEKYAESVEELKDEKYMEILNAAYDYNNKLGSKTQKFSLNDIEAEEYKNLLNINENGVIAYIEIPKIDCYLPVYHFTNNDTMNNGVGHIEWSSLPVGGKSSHCVLSGHRGLPNAKLFTNLDKIREGDIFTLYVLNEKLFYEVDHISIVLPDETDMLKITEDQDYCTLVTCTPYGVNTHRLLVRGKRMTDSEYIKKLSITADAEQLEPKIVAAVVSIPVFLIIIFIVIFSDMKHFKKI